MESVNSANKESQEVGYERWLLIKGWHLGFEGFWCKLCSWGAHHSLALHGQMSRNTRQSVGRGLMDAVCWRVAFSSQGVPGISTPTLLNLHQSSSPMRQEAGLLFQKWAWTLPPSASDWVEQAWGRIWGPQSGNDNFRCSCLQLSLFRTASASQPGLLWGDRYFYY
jgi:hypothetical protein